MVGDAYNMLDEVDGMWYMMLQFISNQVIEYGVVVIVVIQGWKESKCFAAGEERTPPPPCNTGECIKCWLFFCSFVVVVVVISISVGIVSGTGSGGCAISCAIDGCYMGGFGDMGGFVVGYLQ